MVHCNTSGERLDLALLDREDPFEVDDDNRPHLFKHAFCDAEDIYDGYIDGDPVYVKADTEGNADWLMIAMIPGAIITVPLSKPKSGDPSKCRPIGLYFASHSEQQQYFSAGGTV